MFTCICLLHTSPSYEQEHAEDECPLIPVQFTVNALTHHCASSIHVFILSVHVFAPKRNLTVDIMFRSNDSALVLDSENDAI